MVGANAAHAALGLSPHAAVTLGSTIGGALLAVFTELTNLPLQALARRLTALENHRTQTAHDDALTLKVSLFLLTNSYAPLLYVALVQATGRVHSPLSGALEYCHDRADVASSQAELEAAHGEGRDVLQRTAAAECGGVLELAVRRASKARHRFLECAPQQLGRLDLTHLTP